MIKNRINFSLSGSYRGGIAFPHTPCFRGCVQASSRGGGAELARRKRVYGRCIKTAAGCGITQGQEQRVLLRAFRRLCAVRLNTAVGIRQAQPPHGFPVRYRLHPCSATEHSHRRAALKPFLPASRYVAYTQMSTPTIYIGNPAASSHQCSGKICGCGSAEALRRSE